MVVQVSEPAPEADTVPVINNPEDLQEYIDANPEAASYAGGILPVIAESAPKYAEKLLQNSHDGFLVVDKASMRVILYDKYGMEKRAYDMACAKNFGTKHKKADSRTPEGFFSVEGIYNSTDWLYTDDNGVQSKKKGQFGPRFIRLKIPTTSQIGIHGTCSPWSIGHRASHGCIRITNENIMELVELVEPGMPVIVLPGKRDRRVNAQEGYDIPYFPTAPKYAIADAEREETNYMLAHPKKTQQEDTVTAKPEQKAEEKSDGKQEIPADSIGVKASETSPSETVTEGAGL